MGISVRFRIISGGRDDVYFCRCQQDRCNTDLVFLVCGFGDIALDCFIFRDGRQRLAGMVNHRSASRSQPADRLFASPDFAFHTFTHRIGRKRSRLCCFSIGLDGDRWLAYHGACHLCIDCADRQIRIANSNLANRQTQVAKLTSPFSNRQTTTWCESPSCGFPSYLQSRIGYLLAQARCL